jgi:non-heme chloroperoxidase
VPFITTSDGVEIFYKDWGSGQAVVLSHGWPLNSDSSGCLDPIEGGAS